MADTSRTSPPGEATSGGDPVADRRRKLDRLRDELGVDPFGRRLGDVLPLADARALHDPDADAAFAAVPKDADPPPPDPRPVAAVAGRVMLHRVMGNLVFATLRDASGDLQVAVSKRAVGAATFKLARQLDLGDLVYVRGPVGMTKTGEVTVWAQRDAAEDADPAGGGEPGSAGSPGLAIMTKSLAPPPAKWEGHGFSDPELRYRKRYVDLYANPGVAQVLQTRSRIVSAMRRFMDDRRFLEVETPMLQAIAGGAAARPFITHHNALDIQLYLRIAPELYLKRLLVGGLPRVYEINRNFRNEGVDRQHNPEFTVMEVYEAYGDYHTMRELTESLVRHLAMMVEPSGRIPFGELEIDYASPFRQVTFAELFEQANGFPPTDFDAARRRAIELKLKHEGLDDWLIVNEVFEATVEHKLVQPVRSPDPSPTTPTGASVGTCSSPPWNSARPTPNSTTPTCRRPTSDASSPAPTPTSRPSARSTRTSSKRSASACPPPAAWAWASTAWSCCSPAAAASEPSSRSHCSARARPPAPTSSPVRPTNRRPPDPRPPRTPRTPGDPPRLPGPPDPPNPPDPPDPRIPHPTLSRRCDEDPTLASRLNTQPCHGDASRHNRCVITIGNFDGVHRGHQTIMARLVEEARRRGAHARVVTFDPHPITVLRPGAEPPRLMTPERRIQTLRDLGVDCVEVIAATRDLLSKEPEQFIRELLDRCRASLVVEGENFRFGRKRRGDVAMLRELGERMGFDVIAAPSHQVRLTSGNHCVASSSLVRWLVGAGRMADARRCLGRPYTLEGRVARGEQRGRTLGFPTINLDAGEADRQLIPADGVYAGAASFDDGRRAPAAISVGVKPTFAGRTLTVEAHLLDWSGDVYERHVQLRFHRWLRDQSPFPGPDALRTQLRRDVQRVAEMHRAELLGNGPAPDDPQSIEVFAA